FCHDSHPGAAPRQDLLGPRRHARGLRPRRVPAGAALCRFSGALIIRLGAFVGPAPSRGPRWVPVDASMETRLKLDILPQPDDTTCGPTCLHALYRYYDDELSLDTVIDQVQSLEGGGTLAVLLACHALRRGYDATLYTYNLQLFDPT